MPLTARHSSEGKPGQTGSQVYLRPVVQKNVTTQCCEILE